MSSPDNFFDQLEQAIEAKSDWFDTKALPEMLDNYRLLNTCVNNIFSALVQRGLITPDPYKLDKKITGIKSPESEPFSESDRKTVMGQRFSDYETMLNYLCTYYHFTVEKITIPEIKKLSDLNSSFQWDNLSANSGKVNTRFMAALVAEARAHSTGITLSSMTDSLNKASSALARINSILRELSDFSRELYKFEIREKIISSPKFNAQKAWASPDSAIAEIKRLFPEAIGKKTFYGDLINEITCEEQGDDKEARRSALLAKLEVKKDSPVAKKEQVDTKAMLMGAVEALAASAPQYAVVIDKLKANNNLLNAPKDSLGQKILAFIYKLLKLPPKEVDYMLNILDPQTNTKKSRKLEFSSFITGLEKRMMFYNGVATRQAEYSKIQNAAEESILNFLSKQISENQEILLLLSALDEFFKTNAPASQKQSVKGLKMEMTTLKNCIIKSNQKRADYSSYIEEVEQLKKLGIDNA